MKSDLLAQIVIVLHEPRNGANIGAVVRAMKNMGLRRLRLVRPAEFAPELIETLAHRSEDVWGGHERFDDLDSALADVVFVAGTSGRLRGDGPPPQTPRAIAPELLRRSSAGAVALLFGNEDNGLSNADLDRCQALVRIPADPGYASLNLGQAVMLLAYELRLAADQAPSSPALALPAPATAALRDELASSFALLLREADFFKTTGERKVLGELRRLLNRADPSEREARLLLAIMRALRARIRP